MKWSKRFSKKISRRYQLQIKKIRLIIFIFLSIAILFVTHQLLFATRQVSCHTSTDSPCPSVVTNLLDKQKGKSLLLINKKKIISSLQEVSPDSQAQVKLALPGKLIINIKPSQPLAVSVFLNYLQPTLSSKASPINELDYFVSSLSAESYNLFPNGELVPGENPAKINLVFSRKPSQEKLKRFFKLITEINKTIPVVKAYLLKDDLYFTGSNLPDIIISLESSTEKIPKALQAIPSLAKIKEGIKIIDLRFNHPIIR